MHIFHILRKTDWSENTQASYQTKSLNDQGFIHCCTEGQLAGVVQQWFTGEKDLLIMEIDPERLKSKLLFENLEGGQEQFPHIYGPVNPEAIVAVDDFIMPPGIKPAQMRQTIPIQQFIARSHFIFDEGWFLLCSGDFLQKKYNCMTISWGLLGTMWSLPVAMVAVRYSRNTFRYMDQNNSFTLNAFPGKYRNALNELGSRSGRDMDKVNYQKITPLPSQSISSPCYKEAELVIECKKIYWEDMNPAHFLDTRILEKYQKPDYHRFFIGEVVGIFGTIKYLSESLY